MKRTLYSLLILVLITNCKSPAPKETAVVKNTIVSSFTETVLSLDSIKMEINFKPKGDYNKIKSSLINDKLYFRALYQKDKNKAIDIASHYLYSKLLNDIVPHWYGTPWDFNGHTNIPNQGEIACGYFVSTTLRHFRL